MLTTRSEALAAGALFYSTGRPCRRGHVAPRYTPNGTCVDCKLATSRAMEARATAKKWRTTHAAQHTALIQTWRLRHADRYAALGGAALARQRSPSCIPDSYNLEACIPFYAEALRRTRETGIPYEVDHIVPLARGGQHVVSNLQVLTRTENRSKGDRL